MYGFCLVFLPGGGGVNKFQQGIMSHIVGGTNYYNSYITPGGYSQHTHMLNLFGKGVFYCKCICWEFQMVGLNIAKEH